MSESDDSVLDSRLRECVSDTVPPAVESRLRARLADFRSGFCVRDSVAETPRRGITLTAWSRLGLVCAATGLIAVVLGLLLRPRTSFAEVATASSTSPGSICEYRGRPGAPRTERAVGLRPSATLW